MNNNWHTHAFYSMGCHMTVWLEIESDERAEQAFTMVVDAFEQAEQRMSRFRVASELSWLNTQSNRWAQLSPPMWNVIAKAFVLSAETGGLFDPTVHDALIAAGYERSFDDLNGHAASATIAVSLSERASVQLDPEQQAIYLPEGVRLDLGGIGKGFTAQTVVEWLSEWGPCLIDAGGDLTAGDAPSGLSGWPVGIAAPWTHEMPEQENMMRLWLANSSLATSGVD
ncbi:MAG: FAD:protein FMN transferase, partial [Candidatus Promineifilaceae bacterium]